MQEVPQEEEGLFDMKVKVEAGSPYNDGWIKEFYKKVDDENK